MATATERRTEKASTHLTPSELAALDRAAADRHTTRADLLRQLAFAGLRSLPPPVRVPVPLPPGLDGARG